MKKNVNNQNQKRKDNLWERMFGKADKAYDFAGREIHRCDYGKRTDYGWNIDHIFPQCQGGTWELENLVCCNIKTNSEKANNYPDFQANGNNFTIKYVNNHFEIFKVTNHRDSPSESKMETLFSGEINIDLKTIENKSIAGGLINLFQNEKISYIKGTCINISFRNKSKEELDALYDRYNILNACLISYYMRRKQQPDFTLEFKVDE